jgi:hypothetical protein
MVCVCDTDRSAPSRVSVMNGGVIRPLPACDLMMCARIALLLFVHIFSEQRRSTAHMLRLLRSLVVWKQQTRLSII